jgi:hypothetical protein
LKSRHFDILCTLNRFLFEKQWDVISCPFNKKYQPLWPVSLVAHR